MQFICVVEHLVDSMYQKLRYIKKKERKTFFLTYLAIFETYFALKHRESKCKYVCQSLFWNTQTFLNLGKNHEKNG